MANERYHPLVAVDLRNACEYYDAISLDLGSRFREQTTAKILIVIQRPESFGRIGGDFRGALIERFPYVIVFTVENDIVNVYGIRHAASDQATWFSRSMQLSAD